MSRFLTSKRGQATLKVMVFFLSLLPLGWIILQALQNRLGPDPVKELSLLTGEWTLRFLILVLAVTPLRQITGVGELARFRRMIGLFALFYASCHLLVWMTFLLEFRWGSIYEDILERPYITVGFAAYLILVALGVTSPRFMVRRLGRHWVRLHRLVYAAALLAMLHLIWIVRSDLGEAVIYGALVLVLLGYRMQRRLRSGTA